MQTKWHGGENTMTENRKKFFEALSANEEMQEKAKRSQTKEEIVELARELGITLTAADFVNEEGQELSEEELAAVAGGLADHCLIIGVTETEGCVCAMVGVGGSTFCLLFGN